MRIELATLQFEAEVECHDTAVSISDSSGTEYGLLISQKVQNEEKEIINSSKSFKFQQEPNAAPCLERDEIWN